MLIVLNNKCNFTKEEYDNYLKELSNIKTTKSLIICPSSIYLTTTNSDKLILGTQNVSKYKSGAHTGEISAKQLKSLGVKYTIVGHQERRLELNETKEEIKEKINNLISEDIIPILCIGETKEQKESNNYINMLLYELNFIMENLPDYEKEKIIIAYEPGWCIGTGHVPTLDEIYKIVKVIKNNYPKNSILYGGGINENNINSLMNIKDINGFLLGDLSLVPEKIQKFINILEN